MEKIPFNRPPVTGNEIVYLQELIKTGRHFSGDGPYTKNCHKWLEDRLQCTKALLTTSCTHALEMAATLLDLRPGDEVIMPSFTFVSSANPFVLKGATIVFVDIRPDTMNLDEKLIEQAITPRTKAIIPVHYAGIPCEMTSIMDIAARYRLKIVEDAAQAILSQYNGQYLGTLGDFGCLSFHETKNISCGEGGALLIKDLSSIERAEIIREKGTDRSKFFRGQIDKYSWVDIGSSYLPSELNAAVLKAQFENSQEIINRRIQLWNGYYKHLEPLQGKGLIELPQVPNKCTHNGHIFYIKLKNLGERSKLITHMNERGINAVFHYVPLHTSKAGKKYGRFHGEDLHTTKESERLLRLPLYFAMTDSDLDRVQIELHSFFKGK